MTRLPQPPRLLPRRLIRWIPILTLTLIAACGGREIAPGAELAVAPPVVAADAPAQETAGERYKDLPVGFTEEGYPYRGNPDAPLTMYEFSDFQCPFCARHFVQTEPALDDAYVRTGQMRVVFRDLPLVGLHPNAPAAHEAARCITHQGAPLFWAMHDQLFRSQDEWATLADPAPVFARLADEIGANVTIYEACVATREMKTPVQQAVEAALALGFDGTPSFQFVSAQVTDPFDLVGAQPYDRFAATIGALLAGETPAGAQQEAEPGQLPAWATTEGLAVDPQRPGYTSYGDQTRGDADAPIVIVEFSDFQCPYCRKHEQQTQPTLDEKFVATGQVRMVFKHFPLSIHPQAPAAGVAAECAAAQGSFWEMYAALFESQSDWSVNEPNPIFTTLAAGLGLDTSAFESCLATDQALAQVQSDASDGSSFVRGTPTFVLFGKGTPQLIPGALPVESFVAEIEELLEPTPGS